ncbi:DNA-binding domain-containing protein [Salisediminibacterium halotolerans]|uniref:DNA-binding domain-containing protein n=1 Tax=Salisediminibacterium halotolerans TaxID=517425 RepID=UPI000EB194AC|nr:DNA-binding domain-containing protein [Salisediminibacterium halotolerans]RLJ72231.1 two-component system response regulator YcbB [Actinophytocola xinjiangensis]RPE85444.1 two-component system response regulator YcbB [Salisediminibacterium halotolerans]TWG33401.1 two-component system response regulator YcbB [Salisediminibacterium halotolerans]GEL07877.1 transcriptional regulatory protein GlnL [Salisediminibacterium halotolerans]
MNYFIVDDDSAVRGILKNLIESDNDCVVGEEADGSQVFVETLLQTDTDIVIIDLLMPEEDGIDTVRRINQGFNGKIVMISQVEMKEMIAEAYQNNVEAYITKPINRLEVLSVLEKVSKNLRLERSMDQIKHSLQLADEVGKDGSNGESVKVTTAVERAESVLSDLGIRYEKGAEDLFGILQAFESDQLSPYCSLKDLWEVSLQVNDYEISQKNIKATEQRVRRAVLQAFNHISSLGAMDITHPKFEYYAMRFFEMDGVQQRIRELDANEDREAKTHSPRLNIKRFIMAFHDECQQ